MGSDGPDNATTRGADFEVSVYTSFDEMAALAGEWDELALRAGGDIYATLDWCRTWWEYYGKGRRLEAAVVRRGGRLVGVLPFFRETLWLGGLPARLVRLVGCDHSVTTANVIAEDGLEGEVIAAWARTQGGGWDAIDVGPIAGYAQRTAETVEAFREAFAQCEVRVEEDAGPQIVFDLPESYEKYLEGLSKKERGNIVRKERQIRQDFAVETRTRASAGEAAEAFERFLPLHQALWEGKGRLGHFGDWPDAVAFHETVIERLAEKGRVLFFELEAGGAVAASKYCFVFGPRMHTFMTGRDDAEKFKDYALGTVVFAALVDYAIGGGMRQLDAMRGYYEYKVRQGGRVVPLKRILVTGKGMRARAATGLLRAASWFLNAAYYRLWFQKVAPRLGIRTRQLWPTWIRTRV